MPVAYEAGETRPKPKTTPKKKTTPKRTTSAGGGTTGLPYGTVAAPTRNPPRRTTRLARTQPDGTVAPRRRTTKQLLREYRRDHPGPMAMRTADTPWQAERRPRAPGYNPDAPPIVRVGGPTGAAVPRMAAGPAGQALRAGVTPYTGTMRHEGVHVSGSLKPGDAVFFRSDYGHVGLYLGNGKFLEAPFTGSVVRITDMSERSDFMEARRFVNDAGRIFQGA